VEDSGTACITMEPPASDTLRKVLMDSRLFIAELTAAVAVTSQQP